MLQIEIDSDSGFCFGVTTAINKAEEKLAEEKTLYCLGDIVHNGMECERLRQLGLFQRGKTSWFYFATPYSICRNM